jgi:hypothetical protein
MSQVQRDNRVRLSGPIGPWIAVTFLALVAGLLLVELGRSGALAQPMGSEFDAGGQRRESSSLMAVAGRVSGQVYGIYLVDTETRTMALYQWEPNKRRLRWMASRNFSYDLQIEDYNTEMKPSEVKKLAEQADRLTDPAR